MGGGGVGVRDVDGGESVRCEEVLGFGEDCGGGGGVVEGGGLKGEGVCGGVAQEGEAEEG